MVNHSQGRSSLSPRSGGSMWRVMILAACVLLSVASLYNLARPPTWYSAATAGTSFQNLPPLLWDGLGIGGERRDDGDDEQKLYDLGGSSFSSALTHVRHVRGETDTLKTVQCPHLLQQAAFRNTSLPKLNVTLLTRPIIKDPNPNWARHIGYTDTLHPFWVSVHHHYYDKLRFPIIRSGHYYEFYLERLFQLLVQEAPPGSAVIDVGGNIGFYSLLARSMGASVYAFEPNPKNLLRFCESLLFNQWHPSRTDRLPAEEPRVHLYAMGVSDAPGQMDFHVGSNPGGGSLTQKVQQMGGETLEKYPVQVITLDAWATQLGWFEENTQSSSSTTDNTDGLPSRHIAFMKIDVEGHENKVLMGAQKLLQSGLVRNVFTEVTRDPEDAATPKGPSPRTPSAAWRATEQALQVLLRAEYQLQAYGTWEGPDQNCTWPTDEHVTTRLYEKLESMTFHYLNLWWTLDPRASIPPPLVNIVPVLPKAAP